MFGNSFTIITDHRALLSIMKEQRSIKFYNSLLNVEQIDYNLLISILNIYQALKWDWEIIFFAQANQRAKVTNKYDEEFAVATVNSICDASAVTYLNSIPTSSQSQHINTNSNSK